MELTLIATLTIYNDAIQEYEVNYARNDSFWEIIEYLNKMYHAMNVMGCNDAFDIENKNN